jgi:hypothetical protein
MNGRSPDSDSTHGVAVHNNEVEYLSAGVSIVMMWPS